MQTAETSTAESAAVLLPTFEISDTSLWYGTIHVIFYMDTYVCGAWKTYSKFNNLNEYKTQNSNSSLLPPVNVEHNNVGLIPISYSLFIHFFYLYAKIHYSSINFKSVFFNFVTVSYEWFLLLVNMKLLLLLL